MKDKAPHKFFNRVSCIKPRIIEVITDEDGTMYYRCVTCEGAEKLYFKDLYDFNFIPKIKLEVLPRSALKKRASFYDD